MQPWVVLFLSLTIGSLVGAIFRKVVIKVSDIWELFSNLIDYDCARNPGLDCTDAGSCWGHKFGRGSELGALKSSS
jgi:hypothetical protein